MIHNSFPKGFANGSRDGLMSSEDKELLSHILPEQINANRADIDNLNEIHEDLKEDYNAHKNNKSNPHNVTKGQLGLGNVDNTSDLNKPVSNATENRISEVEDIANLALQTARDKVSAIPFDTKADLDAWLAVAANVASLKVGTSFYIIESGTPDYWWDGTTIQILETEKVDLSNYLTLTGNSSNTKVTFTEATSLAKITSGSKLSTLFGTVSKAVSDLISLISKVGTTDISGLGSTVTGAISAISTSYVKKSGDDMSGNLSLNNTTGGDISFSLLRGSAADWRILSSGGNLYIQNNWTTVKGDYFDVFTLSFNTGHATLKGTLTAAGFSGDGASLTNLNASNLNSGTVPVARLATSGATAGSYGPSADASPAHAGTFSVPYITVDKYGRVTAISTKTITLPSDNNTDTKNTAGSTNTSSKIFLIGAASQAANPQTYSHDTVYVGTDGCLYSNSTKVSVEGHTHNYAGSSSAGGDATNALKLSGYSASSSATNNTIALRTSGGYLYATYFNQSSSAETPTTSSYIIYANSDGFFRKSSLENIKSILGLGTAAYTASTAYAAASHSHSYLPLSGSSAMTGSITMGGNRIGNIAGTYNATANARYAYSALEIRENGLVGSAQSDIGYAPSIGFHWANRCAGQLVLQYDGSFAFLGQSGSYGPLRAGNITGDKVYNAIWNDYAEWFEKEDLNEEFEPGDILTWNETGVTKTTSAFDEMVVGVYSDSYGHIIGGEQLDNMEDNVKKFVPLGLCGRVNVKVTGKVRRGQLIVSSDIPGVGQAVSPAEKGYAVSVGRALENKNTEGIGLVKIMVALSN